MAHLEFIFENLDTEKSELLMALLCNLDFEGFEENENALLSYINEESFNEEPFLQLVKELNLTYKKQRIEETNWNAKWESGFDPIDVMHPKTGKLFAHVRASFHQPNSNAIHDLIITPKMSFGTGHHATTLQMMELMSEINFTGKHVIDFGTGTGLLSILAEKMGAASIMAIDNDNWSIDNTNENIMANQCKSIDVIKAEHCLSLDTKADIILANINLNVILANLENIKSAASKQAVVLFSGILNEDKASITNSLQSNGFEILDIRSKNNWLVVKTIV